MSFDADSIESVAGSAFVSIPLEQGNVFRLKLQVQLQQLLVVSIPLEQGNVFRQ